MHEFNSVLVLKCQFWMKNVKCLMLRKPKKNVPKRVYFIPAEASTTTTTTMRVPTTTRQPIRTASRKPNTSVPNCVLAIVNCCSQYDEIVRTPCFEKYNCAGAFFGRSPCSPDIKAAAFREVEKFTK